MALEAKKKLLNMIKEQSNLFHYKYEQKDENFLKENEKEFIKHLNRINTLYAELNHSRKMLTYLESIKKPKSKDFKDRKEYKDIISFLEKEEDFLKNNKEEIKFILRESSKLIWNDYTEKKNIDYSFDEIVNNERNEKFYYSEGILSTYNIRFVPLVISDDILKAFPKHPKDEFQAARSLKRKFYIHEGGTNSGKTYSSIMRLMAAKSGLYLAPLRLLALEIYDKLNNNNVPCSLKTGEEEIIIESSSHISSTVEKVDLHRDYEVVVIDEVQMLGDSQRGAAWTRAILGVRSKEIHLCTAPYGTNIIKKIIEDTDDEFEIIPHERDTELVVESSPFNFPSSVKEGDALIVFSRKSVLTVAATLKNYNIPTSLIYGSLPPETRRMQFEKFLNKETKVLVSTDAIGMGVNLPIKRIVFLEYEKFDGIDRRPLFSSEVKQISGRAGRKGIYDIGYVNIIQEEKKKRLRKDIIKDETPLEVALIAPTEDILKVGADLDTKLKVWASIELEESFYEKINIDRLIELINLIKKLRLNKYISEENIFKAINIPFDEKETELLDLWCIYLTSLSKNASELETPYLDSEDLYELELYYKKIDLYYSFCKTFNFPVMESWVKNQRSAISKLIDTHLKDKIKKYRKSCSRCSAALDFNHGFSICDSCYIKGYY